MPSPHMAPPVYVRRAIVHNLDVVRELEREGAIFVDEAEMVPPGGVLIFSAHGVRPDIAGRARALGLTTYDAVCPLVAKVHREVERHHRGGRQVVLIGHRGHPEIEGTLGHVPDGAAVAIGSVAEVAALDIPADAPVAYAVQTTFAVDDAAGIVAALRDQFADLAEPPSSDICYATTNRQAAVRAIAGRADSVIVAGAAILVQCPPAGGGRGGALRRGPVGGRAGRARLGPDWRRRLHRPDRRCLDPGKRGERDHRDAGDALCVAGRGDRGGARGDHVQAGGDRQRRRANPPLRRPFRLTGGDGRRSR